METNSSNNNQIGIVGCWHHGNLERLRQCLDQGYCDLHPLAENCPKGRMSAERWYHSKMKLEIGDRVRFCVEKRKIVATGEIASEPYDLSLKKGIEPIDPDWSGAVDIINIVWSDADHCPSPPVLGSHRIKNPNVFSNLLRKPNQ